MNIENYGCSRVILPVLASILIAFFLSRYIVNNDANSNGRQNYQEKRRASNPNYDEYIDQASVNGWIPIDPVDKFVDVIESFEMDVEYVFHRESKSKQQEIQTIVNMKRLEMLYLVDVLKRPLKNNYKREINVMPLLFKSIEVMNRVTFRVMKDVLRLRLSRMVTRRRADSIASNIMYTPIKIVLSLIVEIISSPSNYPHLKANVNERSAVHNKLLLNVLDMAVQYQFSPLVPLFLNMNISKENSIKLAIENGDGIILKTLLGNDEISGADELILMAEKLGYDSIASTLKNETGGDPTNEFVPSKFRGDSNQRDNSENTEKLAGIYDRDDNGGYSKVTIDILRHEERLCDIDRFNFSDMEEDPQIFDSYLSLNKPVIISFKETDFFLKLRHLFSLMNLASSSEVKVDVSAIPYGNHYGYDVHKMSLQEYITNIMKPYTGMITTVFAEKSSGEVDLNSSIDAIGHKLLQDLEVPMYVFKSTEIVKTEEIHSHLNRLPSYDTFKYLLKVLGNGNITNTLWQQYIGPIFSGAPFHNHGPALNFLIFGSKQWGMLPPGNAIFSSIPPLEVLKMKYGGSFFGLEQKVLEGTCYVNQRAGEMMFVPRHFSHQIVNLADSAGIAIEGTIIYEP